MRFFIFLFFITSYLYGDCSKYIGSVTINEVYKPSMTSMGDPFLEFATVDGTNIDENWTINVYSNDTKKTYNMSANSCDEDDDNDYKEIKLDDKDEIDLENGMSISLLDADGNYIDYLVMSENDVEGHYNDCDWEYDSDVSTKDIDWSKDSDTYREPDSTGDWKSENKSAMMSENNTKDCTSNDNSKKIYVDPNGDEANDGDSCDEAKYDTINKALDTIRDTTDGPYTVKVCTGDYNEFLDLNNSAFNGLTIRGSGRNVNLNTQEENGRKKDTMIDINSPDIEKITFYNINFIHDVSCNSCDGSDGKFIFDFKENANSASSSIKIGNIPTMSINTCPAFNFSSDNFAGHFAFSGFGNFKSSCEAVKLDKCEDSKESFSFSSMIFKFMSDKTDMFGFDFGSTNDVSKDCNISLENISLDMNKSSGIHFKERGDFNLDGFTFENSSDDDSKPALKIEKLSGTQYKFDHLNIDTSGVALDLNDLNEDINLTISNARLVSRLNHGLVLPTIKTATFNNIRILAKEQAMDLNISEDLNITDSRLKSNKCGFTLADGNPMFDGFHISSGDCKYSFRKTGGGIKDTAFIHNSSFGLKQTGDDTFPLDWGPEKTFDLNNSCFCPKQKDNFGAIYRPWANDDTKSFSADGNFWKYLPSGDTYNQKGFKDDHTLESCPHSEFIDACSKIGGFISYYKPKRDDNNISDSNMTDQKPDVTFDDINISSIDGTDETKLIDFNGTVCAKVIDNNSNSNMDWIKVFINDGNTTEITDFNSTFSTQNATVKFRWARNTYKVDTDCDDQLNTSEADSPNNFKIISDTNASFIAYTSLDDSNISDSNFTTKKVDKNIKFTIASIDDTNNSQYKEFNGTVCYEIYDIDNNSSWSKITFNDENTSDVNTTVDFTSKSANVKFKWKKNEDKNCSDSNFDGNISSLDKFAIIPTKFIINLSSKLKAGESYKLDINATDDNNNTTKSYTQHFSSNDKNLTLWFNSKVNGMELNTTYSFDIIEGNGSKDDFNISDVGEYLLKIIDTDYANIDANDTDEINRTIEGDITIQVTPYLFDLNVTTHEASTKTDWAYINQESNESNWSNKMNYTLLATLTAKNKQGEITKAFDKDEYSFDVKTTINFGLNMSSGDITKYYKQYNSNFDVSNNEFNTSKESFNDGISNIKLIYRVDKNISQAISPIRTNLKDFNLSNIGTADKNITKIDDNLTWYYSRLKIYPIISYSEDTVTNKFYITIYKENTKPKDKEIELNWYINNDDSITKFQDSDFTSSKNTNISNTTSPEHSVTVSNSSKNGKVNFKIKRNNGDDSDDAIIHTKIPRYFWYSRNKKDYSDINNSRCWEHTCSKYTYIRDKSGNNISTGKYTGGDIDVKDRNYTKKGIKVFR